MKKYLIDPNLSPEYQKIAIEAIMLKLRDNIQKLHPKHLFVNYGFNDVLLNRLTRICPFYTVPKGTILIDKTTTTIKKETTITPTCPNTPNQIENEIEKFLYRKRSKTWLLNLYYHDKTYSHIKRTNYIGLSATLIKI